MSCFCATSAALWPRQGRLRPTHYGITASARRSLRRWEDQADFATARYDTLHTAELGQGVDTDVEMQNLLLIEQSYAANAKVLSAVDQMMQRLLEL